MNNCSMFRSSLIHICVILLVIRDPYIRVLTFCIPVKSIPIKSDNDNIELLVMLTKITIIVFSKRLLQSTFQMGGSFISYNNIIL